MKEPANTLRSKWAQNLEKLRVIPSQVRYVRRFMIGLLVTGVLAVGVMLWTVHHYQSMPHQSGRLEVTSSEYRPRSVATYFGTFTPDDPSAPVVEHVGIHQSSRLISRRSSATYTVGRSINATLYANGVLLDTDLGVFLAYGHIWYFMGSFALSLACAVAGLLCALSIYASRLYARQVAGRRRGKKKA